MKLDRNIPGSQGYGKYGLLHLRRVNKLRKGMSQELPRGIMNAIRTLDNAGLIEWGDTPETDFFVLKLRDAFAQSALHAYADAASSHDDEYSGEVRALARRSGRDHPMCKFPD